MVIRPQDHGVFVSKREFVLAHKGWVVSVITNSSLLPSTRSSTKRWTMSAVDGWAQPTASAFWCPICQNERKDTKGGSGLDCAIADNTQRAPSARPQAQTTRPPNVIKE